MVAPSRAVVLARAVPALDLAPLRRAGGGRVEGALTPAAAPVAVGALTRAAEMLDQGLLDQGYPEIA